ncbi:single-stranded DNA-binding protein [Mycoplasmatota bacterium WC44]
MINRVVLVGRLTKDPELRYTGSNIAVVTFTLAVNRNFAAQDGNREADFIQCIAWRKTAENISKYVRKGSLVGVDGRIQTGSYQAQDGSRRYTTDVVCDNVRFLDSRESAPQNDFTSNNNDFSSRKEFKQEKEDPFFSSSNITIDDDDLPF